MTKVVFLGFVLILNITKKMRQIAVKQKNSADNTISILITIHHSSLINLFSDKLRFIIDDIFCL
tara:strand:- start:1294 stop:1485 length:192 start_codon:yes stop_codon:yes gene_type:complete